MSDTVAPLPITSVDIDAAACVLAPFAIRTPLLSSPALDERVGEKCSSNPKCCSGPDRLNSAERSTSSRRSRKRCGEAVWWRSLRKSRPGGRGGGADLNMRATIVMPADAPRSNANDQGLRRGSGAVRPRSRGPRSHRRRNCPQTCATLVRPYDDLKVIAGKAPSAARSRKIWPRSASPPTLWSRRHRRRSGRGCRDSREGPLPAGGLDVGRARRL